MRLTQRTVAVALSILLVPTMFLISCGSSPPDEPQAGSATTAESGSAGQAASDRNRPVAIKWIAMEQVSPIVGDDGSLTEALGLEMPGGAFQQVIAQGEAAPVTRQFTLATAVTNQREMTVHVLRGDADRAEENTSLGWYRIEDIPPGPPKETLISLVLRVADNAIVGAALMPNERLALRMVQSAPPPER